MEKNGSFLNFNDPNEFDERGESVRFDGVYISYGDISLSKYYKDRFAIQPHVVGVGSDFYIINRDDNMIYHQSHIAIRNFKNFCCKKRELSHTSRVEVNVEGENMHFWVCDTYGMNRVWFDDYVFDLDLRLNDNTEVGKICDLLTKELIKHQG